MIHLPLEQGLLGNSHNTIIMHIIHVDALGSLSAVQASNQLRRDVGGSGAGQCIIAITWTRIGADIGDGW